MTSYLLQGMVKAWSDGSLLQNLPQNMPDAPDQSLTSRVNNDHIRLRVLLRLKSNEIPGPLLSRPFTVMSDFYSKVLERECNWDVDYFHLGGILDEVHTCNIVLDLNVGELDQSLDDIPIAYYGVGYKEGIL